MKRVERTDVIDYQTYNDRRDGFRDDVLAEKIERRIHVGECLTFLFENRLTVLYQVQEMMRTEQIVREADIQHELDTYNELLGGDGELGSTLLIEIPNPEERDRKLREYLELIHHLYMEVDGGGKVRPKFDERQVGDDRLSSVQFLKWDTGGKTPLRIGSDLPQLLVESDLTDAQRAALAADLAA